MAPDTTRKAVNLAAADARRAIEALQEQSISLQRELAEARAEIDSLKSRASLTPLADPSVRGVLVPCADDDPHLSIVVDDVTGRKCVGKLRPASEFGVPAKPKAEVRFEANEGVPSLERVQLAINTLGYYGQFQQGQDGWAALCILRAHLAALKSTPAEPAQKLVPLPEGARVFVPADESGDFAVVDSGFPVSPIVGRFNEPKAHYGVPAERAWDQTELHRAQCEAIGLRAEVERQCERIASLTSAAETAEAEVARLEIVGHEGAARCERYKSEAERLRKAIEHVVNLPLLPLQCRKVLRAALTPPTAASGEETETELELLSKSEADIAAGYGVDAGERVREMEGENADLKSALGKETDAVNYWVKCLNAEQDRHAKTRSDAEQLRKAIEEAKAAYTTHGVRSLEFLDALEALIYDALSPPAAESGGKAMQCLDEIGEAMTSSAPAAESEGGARRCQQANYDLFLQERSRGDKWQSEAKRLRKAIEAHRHTYTGMASEHRSGDRKLWSALTPQPAAEESSD